MAKPSKPAPFVWCSRLAEASDDVIGTVLHHALARWAPKGAVGMMHKVERVPSEDGIYAFLAVAVVWGDKPPLDIYSESTGAYRGCQADLAARFDVHATIEAVSRDTARGMKRDGWYVLTEPVELAELKQVPMSFTAAKKKPAAASPPAQPQPTAPSPPEAPTPPAQRSLF